MESRILGKYKIVYDNGFVQYKNLISHDDYVNIIKVKRNEIYEIEMNNKFRESNQSRKIKEELKEMFGNVFFTDKSPLYEALVTGILTLPYGEPSKCQITLVKD